MRIDRKAITVVEFPFELRRSFKVCSSFWLMPAGNRLQREAPFHLLPKPHPGQCLFYLRQLYMICGSSKILKQGALLPRISAWYEWRKIFEEYEVLHNLPLLQQTGCLQF